MHDGSRRSRLKLEAAATRARITSAKTTGALMRSLPAGTGARDATASPAS
jgi:hypothetical protein